MSLRIIRLKEVIDSTGLSRSTLYKYIADGIFPSSVSLGGRAVGWVESEVHDWILDRIEQRDNQSPNAITSGVVEKVSFKSPVGKAI